MMSYTQQTVMELQSRSLENFYYGLTPSKVLKIYLGPSVA